MKALFSNKYFFLCLFMVSAGLLLAAEAANDKPGSFRRAFIQIDDNGNNTPITREMGVQKTLKSNYQFFFRPLRNAYLYVLLFGPGDNLTIVFPGSFIDFEQEYDTFEQYIPEEGSWRNYLKDPGTYELHFLVAEKRMAGLEKLTGEYLAVKKKKNSYYTALKIRKEIQYEIQRMKRNHFLPNKIKIKLVKEAGTRRAGSPVMIKNAESISFKELYAETFFLEYE